MVMLRSDIYKPGVLSISEVFTSNSNNFSFSSVVII